MQRAARLALLLWWLASWTATAWVLSLNPFAAPLVERTAAEARAAFTRAMALRVTPDWLIPRLEAAVEADAPDDIVLYRQIAAEHGVAIPADLAARADAVLAAHDGVIAATADCARCAWDIASCPTLTMIGACALPVELSPLGDLNALRRAAADWAAGEEVDRLDLGLALVGLAATGAVVVSGGGTATAKIGATTIRMARRMGALSPRFLGALTDAVSGLVRWHRVDDLLLRRIPLEDAVDAARWSRLTEIAGDAGRLRANTSAAEALVLLREADRVEDLGRLARVSDAAGTETRKVMRVLGQDAFRLLRRASHLAELAIGLVAFVTAQLATLALGLLRLLLRAFAGRPRRSGIASRATSGHDRAA